ncbi:PP2C family protein-serine/threonine phosphatase [Psychrobacter sp. I-STPA6b]|uniref:PP2C family protein-serine/threonine phosphatase n=1 Tax=Psychrobacter sp. I-STPA6b TaxID=2585718 RepID=UPI001D0CA91C|nr:protein phosphatase 2C domain-containing protein [Psychrobacter sp. I-STPA6b]
MNNTPSNNTNKPNYITSTSSLPSTNNNHFIKKIQTCAITFQGNASNGLQQDAFFFLDDWYQETLGIMPIQDIDGQFCLAVSDGVASSNYSQHCAKAVVKAIATLWQQQHSVSINDIYQWINNPKNICKNGKKLNPKWLGACATLAMVQAYPLIHKSNQNNDDNEQLQQSYDITITHMGDSRVYLQRLADNQLTNKQNTNGWRWLTRDHNLLNELVEQKANEQGIAVNPNDYNKDGMAGSLYGLTECFMLGSSNEEDIDNEGTQQTLNIQAGDCLLICTDGIHDLVPCQDWQSIDANTELDTWLKALKKQVYHSKGRAYDNGTAIVVRFL